MRDAASYWLARALEGALGRMSEPRARAVGERLGRLAYRPLAIRRGVVEAQIASAFPDRSADWVTRTARACYAHFGREAAVALRLGRAGRGAVLERTADAGRVRERYRALSGGGAAIVVTGHLGNWELAGSVLGAAGLPVSAVARRQQGRFERRLAALRADLGIETIPEGEAPRGVPRALAEGRVVALVADQHAGPRGTVVTFLGRPASTFRGPARLALACDVPLLFGALVREGEGYRALLERVGPAEPDARGAAADEGGGAAGAGRDAEAALTRAWVARLEAAVRERPEQYFWFHRRWKAAERQAAGSPRPGARDPAGTAGGAAR